MSMLLLWWSLDEKEQMTSPIWNCMPTGAVHFLPDHVKPCHGYVADKRGRKEGKGQRTKTVVEDGFLLLHTITSYLLCMRVIFNQWNDILELGVGRYSCRTALLFVVASTSTSILLVVTTRTRTTRPRGSVVISIRSWWGYNGTANGQDNIHCSIRILHSCRWICGRWQNQSRIQCRIERHHDGHHASCRRHCWWWWRWWCRVVIVGGDGGKDHASKLCT